MNMPYAKSIKIRSLKKLKSSDPKGGHKLFIKGMASFFLVLILCGGFKLLFNRLSHCDFFQITAVKIYGNHMTSKEQITSLSRVDIHSNLLAVNVDQVESILESLPWISKAEVIRDWPNRLVINLQEKTPVALLNRETGLFYLDDKGEIIAAVSPSQDLDFPVITGLEKFSFNPALPKSQTNSIPEPLRDVFELLRLANRNNPILPEQNISEIHVAANNELIIHLLEKPFPIYLGNVGKISTRYYRLVKVLKDLYKTHEFSEISYIRLNYQEDTILVGKVETERMHQG
jgi:cell division septal protein FtsQ